MSVSPNETTEVVKVGAIGVTGMLAGFTLTDVATVMSILVGFATLVYIVAKTVFLVKKNARSSKELD